MLFRLMLFRLTLYSLILCAVPTSADVLPLAPGQAQVSAVTLRFCYEDKQLLPYYAGNSAAVPDQPGATIEHLKRAAMAAGITLELVRMPWLRCLQQLEDNEVDALVAAYEPSRAHYTRYPTKADGTPDASLAINHFSLCLAHRYDNPLVNKIALKHDITVSRPLGYRPIPFPYNTALVDAYSPEHALELVVSGRVDATTVLCELNGIKAQEQHLMHIPVVVMYPPLYRSSGYLMISRQFYQHYPQYAVQLWQALPHTIDKNRYLQYLTYPVLTPSLY